MFLIAAPAIAPPAAEGRFPARPAPRGVSPQSSPPFGCFCATPLHLRIRANATERCPAVDSLAARLGGLQKPANVHATSGAGAFGRLHAQSHQMQRGIFADSPGTAMDADTYIPASHGCFQRCPPPRPLSLSAAETNQLMAAPSVRAGDVGGAGTSLALRRAARPPLSPASLLASWPCGGGGGGGGGGDDGDGS